MRLKNSRKITLIIIAVLAIYAIVNLIRVKSDLDDAVNMTAELKSEIKSVSDENLCLQDKIDNAGSEEAVEKEARERLGLVKNNDIIFIDEYLK